MRHHTKEKGDLAVTKVISDMTEKGYSILLPISEHLPFDLVAYINSKLYRIQVKYVAMRDGSIKIKLYNTWADKNGTHKSVINRDEVDLFAVYCKETNACYYFSPSSIKNNTQFNLRVDKTKNNQTKNIYYANDFLVPKV